MNNVVNTFLLMAIVLIVVVMNMFHPVVINARRIVVLKSIKMELQKYV